MTVPEACFAYLVRLGPQGLEVLLGDKLVGLGRGRVTGIGGEVDAEERAADAAVRHLGSQIGVAVEASALLDAGTVEYRFPTRPSWSRCASVFVCRTWSGDPAPSNAIEPRWYPLADIPYGRMWGDAPRWLPGVLRGGHVDARFTFAADLATVVLEVR